MKSANTNLLCYLTMHPEIRAKLLEEIKKKVFIPYVKENKTQDGKSFIDFLNYESSMELNYFTMCFNESLRIEPPVSISGSFFL